MNKGEKISSFVKEFIAHVQGDTSKVLAQKVYRQADGALSSQIALEKAALIQAETQLETAKELKAKAIINNGKLIEGMEAMTTYVDNILAAENSVIEAEDELKERKAKIKFLETTLANLKTEVEDTIAA
jgi:hypothetical protein